MEKEYQDGRQYAEFWISRGGSLYPDCPEGWSEAKCNGFCDRVAEERKNVL